MRPRRRARCMLNYFIVGRTPQDTTESTLVFTKGRDIHAVGIALVQMLMGRDVMDRFPDPQSALHTSEFCGDVCVGACSL